MAAVRAVAEPLRTRLNIPPMQQHTRQLQAAQQLPQPLHTAFLQLRAVQEAYGLPADISISGVQSLRCLRYQCWGKDSGLCQVGGDKKLLSCLAAMKVVWT